MFKGCKNSYFKIEIDCLSLIGQFFETIHSILLKFSLDLMFKLQKLKKTLNLGEIKSSLLIPKLTYGDKYLGSNVDSKCSLLFRPIFDNLQHSEYLVLIFPKICQSLKPR